MERKLYEAALTGDLLLLDERLRYRVASLSLAEENPLHIASWFGHVEFVKGVLYLNPSLVRGLDSQGLCPLHLASAKGHAEVARVLLDSDPFQDVCFFRDQKGRTPLHIAAEKGRVGVLRALVKVQPRAAWVMTNGGDPILHLCINHNQFEALTVLVEKVRDSEFVNLKDFVNLRDDDDNTVLHLLASKGQHKVIQTLVEICKDGQLAVDAVNVQGLTALDISTQYSFGGWVETTKILSNIPKAALAENRTPGTQFDQRTIRKNLELEKNYRTWLSNTRETLMVVAILMATVTFQAGLNPPGGVWQCEDCKNENIRAGQAIMYIAPRQYMAFIIFNSIGFVASLSLIVVLVGRFSINEMVALWTTMVWIVVISILLIYTCSLSFLTTKNVSASFGWSGGPISFGWGLILTGILLLVRFPPRGLVCLYEIIAQKIGALIESIRIRSWRLIKDLIYDKAWRPIKGLLRIRDSNAESGGDA